MVWVRLLLSVLFWGVISTDAFHSSYGTTTTPHIANTKNRAVGLFRSNDTPLHRVILKLSDGTSPIPPEKAPHPFFYGVMGAMYYIPIRYMAPQYKNLSAMSLAFYLFGRAVLLLDRKWLNKLVIPTIPPPLPATETATIFGIAEAIVAALLFLPQYQPTAGKLAVVVLAASTPASIYHVFSKNVQQETGIGVRMASVRLVFQGLFLHWANWFAMPW
jgi:uncharacterized membrane protein